jgi:hypothetical protein
MSSASQLPRHDITLRHHGKTIPRHRPPIHIPDPVVLRLRARRSIVPKCLSLPWRFNKWTTHLTASRSSHRSSPSPSRAKLLLLGIPHAKLLRRLRLLQSRQRCRGSRRPCDVLEKHRKREGRAVGKLNRFVFRVTLSGLCLLTQ